MSSRVAALLSVFICAQVWAQSSPPSPTPADLSQEAYVFERLSESVRFENDGSGVRESTAVIRVQSQAGVQGLGQLVFGYSTANEDLQIDYVRVRRLDGQVIETPASTAQDFAPEVLREAPMYSDFRQRHVSVVGLQPGVVLEYHIVTKLKPLAPGEFWYEYSFPDNSAVTDGSLLLNLPKSREVKLKSPDRKFEIRDEGDRSIYSWSVKNFVPDRKKREEQQDEETPDVQLSSFTDWQQVAQWYAKLQSERAMPDETIRKKAAELTHGVTTPEEKARRLYDFVAQNIRYVSLSFGVGRFQPHAGSEVLQTGYGDCKDKHTLLQSLLAAQGIESYPVLIHSERKLDPDVPSPAQFDHLITAAKLGEKLTWLDATAEVAPYGLIAYQLRNKQAVIASSEAAGGLHRTPAESPVKNATTLNIDAKFSELGALDAKVDLTATGDDDWPMRSTLRQVSQANWPRVLEFLSRAWGLPGDVTDIHVDAIENTAKPLHLSYHLHKADYFKVPSSATNFQLLPPMSGGRVQAANKKHPGEPLDVGPAEVRTYHVRAELPANFTLHVPADVSVTRDYGEYSSSYKLLKNTLEAERRLVLKVNELPASKRADFSSFHNVTTSAVEETPWCSIAKPSASALASASELKGTSTELREAGQAALKRQDFATAATLLQRAADQDPATKEGWDDLGQAYARLNQHQKATQAFEKQLDADPDHAHAHAELGAELQQLGRFDDAIAAYKKQIEVAPSEKASHKQLGLLFSQLKRDQEARTELEAAALLPPDDPDVQMALAQVYSRLGESKKADVSMVSLTGTTSLTGGTDFFAGALREDADPVQSAHDAEKTLSDISDQFESGEYDRLDASAFSIMDLVALSWARMGWARFLQGDNLAASQFLDAAWQLSQSGTVANRLAKVYEKSGGRDRARHMFALAITAGGPDAESSRREMTKLGAANVEKDLSQTTVELEKMRVMSFPQISSQPASAHFALLFDNSSSPDRVQFLEGDQALRPVAEKLQKLDYAVRFPDVSSIKIIRLGAVSCSASECKLTLQPLNSTVPGHQSLQASAPVQHSSSTQEATPNLKTPEQSGSSPLQVIGVPAGSGTTPPRLISAPDPVYTDAARRAMLQGIVVVSLVVGTDGLVRDPHILTSLRHDLDESALQAVREWKFEPARKNGQPIEVHVNVQVSFRLYQNPLKN